MCWENSKRDMSGEIYIGQPNVPNTTEYETMLV